MKILEYENGISMETIFMQAVMTAFFDKVTKKNSTYDKNVLKSEWENVNKNLLGKVLGNINHQELPNLPKKHIYMTCKYLYTKGDKAGKECGKTIKNPNQERCFLHNPEKLMKIKEDLKTKKENNNKKTINQTVVTDNQIVSPQKPKKIYTQTIEHSSDNYENKDIIQDDDNLYNENFSDNNDDIF